jgi:uncharacterized protein YukE
MMESVAAVANPDELEAKARQLRSEANALEKALDPLTRSTRGSSWQGSAAQQFQTDMGTDQRAAAAYAADLRAAATAMDTGATQIRRYLAEMKRLQQEEKLGHMATTQPY